MNDRHTSAPLSLHPVAPDPARASRRAAGAHGLLITFEGIDHCGKSTQVLLLRDALLDAGLPVGCDSAPGAVLREPGESVVRGLARQATAHFGERVGLQINVQHENIFKFMHRI